MSGSRFPRWPSLCPAVLAVLGCLSTAGLHAQDAQLDRKVRFVRGLARELRFITLAQSEADRLQEQFKSAAAVDKLAQLGIEISLMGAEINANRASQRTLYKEALERSKELIERTSDPVVARDARITLADACQKFGSFLVEELEIARTENPDAVKELEEEAANVFRAGVDACDKVMGDLEAEKRNDPQKQLDYNLTWLRKGILLREHGRAVRADRGYLCERAKSTLEELILEVGEETALGLRGLFEYAQCDEVLGNTKDAATLYEDTIEQISTSLDEAAELGLNADTQQFLFNMMQEIYDHLARLLFDNGEMVKLAALFEQFEKHLTTYGQEGLEPFEIADPRYGHSVFLTKAQVMAESGDPAKVQQALAMAQKINDEHPSDIIGVRAKRVIKDILDAQQRLVSGSLLFEVAKGEYQNKNYEEAIKGMKKALAAMSADERNALGLEAYKYMGYAYALTDRFLEGVLAMKEGLQRYGKADPESAEEVADRLDLAMRQLQRQTRNDPYFERLTQEVTQVVAALGGAASGNKLYWKQANQFWAGRDYKKAAETFARISREGEFLYYELAQSRRAMALERAGDYAAAKQAIADYRKWLDTKDAVIETRRTDLQQVREQAIAELDFCEVTILYNEATGAPEAKTKKDLTRYPAVIEKLQTFIANHKSDGANFIPRAYDMMGRLYAELGQMDKAEEAYRSLKEVEPEGVLLPMLGTVIFDSYLTQVENLDKEWRAALAQGKEEAAKQIEQQLKLMRQKLVNVGMEYARNAPKPQYGVLSNTLYQLDILGDWARVDEIARKMISLYGNDPDYKDRIDRVVRPKVGEALLRQRQFQQAYDMLIQAEKAYPNLWEVKRLIALCLGGWFEFDERGSPVVVPGLDRPDEAYNKYFIEYKPWGLRPEVEKFSLEWYRFHWEAYWFALRAIPKDDAFKERARSLYRIAQSIDNFATLRKLGPEGEELWDRFQANRPPPR